MHQPLAPDSLTTVALRAIVTGLEAVERAMPELEAERVRLLTEAFDLAAIESEEVTQVETHVPLGPRGDLALRAIRAEIAVALEMSERTVDRHLAHAHTLTRKHPAVFSAFRAGELSYRHTTVICDAGDIVGSGTDVDTLIRRADFADAALEAAAGATPAVLAARAKRLAEHYAETPLDERHEAARRERRVWVEDREHGMADLIAHLPATVAYAIKNRLSRLAERAAQAELAERSERNKRPAHTPQAEHTAHAEHAGQTQQAPTQLTTPLRIRDEIRADVLADLLLGRGRDLGGNLSGDASSSDETRGPVQAVVQVLLNASDLATPELEGYGPIDRHAARGLAADAEHWELISTDTETGEVLAVDRYRPSEKIRRTLRARDRHCRFPGCRVPAVRCDIDHTVDAALGGDTSTSNLSHICRGHHTLKPQTGWQVQQQPGGVLTWTSPTGRTRQTRPPGQVRQPGQAREPGQTRQPGQAWQPGESRVRFEASEDLSPPPAPSPFSPSPF